MFGLLQLICIIVILLTGCWDRVEVNDLAIITAAAIDYHEDDQIKLSVQLFIPRAISSGGESGGGTGGDEQTIVRTGIGINLADAISKLQVNIPRKIFWGHCKVFIFGEELAKNGIQETMDFLLRHPQPRERAYMYVSKGEAKKILSLIPPIERYSSEVLREISDLKIGMLVTMKDLDLMLTSEAQAPALPLVEILPPEEGKEETKTIPIIKGTAVFKKDKMVGEISQTNTRGLLWFRKEIKDYTANVKIDDEGEEKILSLMPVKTAVNLKPTIKNNQWIITVKIKTEGDIVQNGTNYNTMEPAIIDKFERKYREDIENRIQSSFAVIQNDLNADVVNVASEFHHFYPKEWDKVKKKWDEKFPEVKLDLDVEAYIRRPGYISTPGGLPEDEVKKK
ncbi:Ger(x)C family spore germination protein [Bacillus sp. FJAT-47783]|uniref:Ger(x)C family spore germination protein n=1 Tax=Bacillus sp. FJAT-47783 TaxID=2922712 RepID=UPI001FADB59E|nr:Ger(x)C family spore germination protein [Bacillus sp. FJAT-47783]